MSTIWHPLASDTIPEPFCYLHHIPIPHPIFLIQSLELPNPSPHPITSPTTPYHILYKANPTYYLSFCAALYSSFVCLSSTPIAEGNISSLGNWLLTFHSKFLEESDLSHHFLPTRPNFTSCPCPSHTQDQLLLLFWSMESVEVHWLMFPSTLFCSFFQQNTLALFLHLCLEILHCPHLLLP
ncbi:uncharacterized protein ACA1_205900 [Acanthamoeba castellanii str. Neff]|uniref:Uncharacterized protein n=1 Tax=Acanthamoeba castellanii (strain ATCC 30010 / Neff) TaxID=1257118 RepID=L8H5F1_ACACF|nr:uncharacterized protein ACA1_205900 [Acanthamoeba castellanii str. Neff]ELR20452.1 hypothetical protein ACA1_205900 [Acanthamoeba castellanii str. Neff]